MTPNKSVKAAGKSLTPQPEPQEYGAAEVKPRKVRGITLHHTLEEDYSVYEPATFVERGFATLIDSFIVGIAVSLMNLPFLKIIERFTFLEQSGKITAMKFFITGLALAFFQIVPLLLWGQTLGKSFFGIILVTEDHSSKLGVVRVLTREMLGKLLSVGLLGFGLLLMIWRRDRLSLHDLMCKTKVVKHRRLD